MKTYTLDDSHIWVKIPFSKDNETFTFGSLTVSGINQKNSAGIFHTLNRASRLIELLCSKTLTAVREKSATQLLAESDMGFFHCEKSSATVVVKKDALTEEEISDIIALAISLSCLMSLNDDGFKKISELINDPSLDRVLEVHSEITNNVLKMSNYGIKIYTKNETEGEAKIVEWKEALRTSSDTFEAMSDIPTPKLFNDLNTEKPAPLSDEIKMSEIFKFDRNEWSLEAQKLIPNNAVYEAYLKGPSFYRMAKFVSSKTRVVAERIENNGFLKTNAELLGENGSGAINLLIYGPPGSGKTQAIDALAAFMSIPVYRISGTDKAEDGDIKGKAGIDEHGNFKNIITVARQAIENGGILCIEEYNLMPPALFQGILGQTVVYPYKLLTNEETYIDRHPHCIIMLTKNTNTEGTVEQNQAFNNRFAMRYFPEQQESLFIDLITRYDTGCGKANKRVAKRLYNIYKKIKEFLCSPEIGEEDLALELSLRTCYQVLETMYCGGESFEEAVKEQIGGHILHNNTEIGKQINALIDATLL